MIKEKIVNINVSRKIIAENLLQQICLRNNNFVLEEIKEMEDATLILMPLVENGTIEYDTERTGYDWDESERTIPHYLNILEFLIENKKYAPILEAIFDNPKIKEALENNNVNIFKERAKFYSSGKGYPEPTNYFTLNNMVQILMEDFENISDKKHIFKVINTHYNKDDILLHLAGPEAETRSDIKKIKKKIKEVISTFSYMEIKDELPINPDNGKKQLKV